MLTILRPNQPYPAEFPKGALLLVDKPLGWSSFDVVNKIRHHLSRRVGIKRIKIGHAGTLDPLATGLLLICVGDYTKRIESLQGMPKEYTGTLTFGATTPSFDLEKAVNATFPTAHLNDALLQTTKSAFIGDIEQIPPVFSAVKVDGRRLYKNARTGETVDIPVRTVHIETLELGPLRKVLSTRDAPILVSFKGAQIMLHPDHADGLQSDFKVVCSKGTYIRTLASDLGQAVGSGAYLSALRRTAIGAYLVDDAWPLEDLVAWAKGEGAI